MRRLRDRAACRAHVWQMCYRCSQGHGLGCSFLIEVLKATGLQGHRFTSILMQPSGSDNIAFQVNWVRRCDGVTANPYACVLLTEGHCAFSWEQDPLLYNLSANEEYMQSTVSNHPSGGSLTPPVSTCRPSQGQRPLVAGMRRAATTKLMAVTAKACKGLITVPCSLVNGELGDTTLPFLLHPENGRVTILQLPLNHTPRGIAGATGNTALKLHQ